ncbi:endonuclease/exonuclease/phosphatase family protein [Streptomyces sp. 4N509B]|uniref:endonuclease/exonuclease/phosphatase family protein n=1 Tax=Streptomyces sp. 4N509B TaxID=3457413 RepID=UPI003FD48A3E
MARLFTPGARRGPRVEADSGAAGPEPEEDGGRRDGVAGRVRRWCAELPGHWRRGWVVVVAAVLLALVMLLHSRVPNAVGNLGSLLQTFLPWLGLGIPVLGVCAAVRRSATAGIALLLPALVWFDLFGGLLRDKTDEGGALMVISHNVDADNPDPAVTAHALAGSGADVIALQELPEEQLETYEEALAARFPHSAVEGTVGLWSRYPISDTAAVDIGLGWTRAMRATVTPAEETGLEQVAVYVAHLPSVRVQFDAGFTAGRRDEAADLLGQAIAAEPLAEVVLLGDLNGTMNDGALAPLTSQLRSAQGAAGEGFGFSWPAGFPMTRIDQILVRGLEPVSAWTLPSTGSDHLPVASRVDPVVDG